MDAEAPPECVSEDGREVWLHSGRMDSRWLTEMPEWIRALPGLTSLAGRLDDAERLEKIHAALRGLRRTERDVLALCVWSGLNYLCVTGLLIERGERTPISPFPVTSDGKVDRRPPKGTPQLNFTCPSLGHLGDATYRLMQSMPTQPGASGEVSTCKSASPGTGSASG